MTPKEKVEQFTEVWNAINKDYASRSEMEASIARLVDFLKTHTQTINKALANTTEQAERDYRRAQTALDRLSDSLRSELRSLPTTSDLTELERRLEREIGSIRTLIPTLPDLAPLFDRIEEVYQAIPTLPEPLVGEDFRNALEALPDGEKLAIEAIQDLREELDELRKVRSAPGGGGGNLDVSHWPRHEEFSMDGVATTITLIQAPGANGNAIFACRYQGQVLDKDTHYTVDGNKITLVGFTPESGTIISITYMP